MVWHRRLKENRKMKIAFIRHGKTEGNLTKKYVGRTDESLCAEGIRELNMNIIGGMYDDIEPDKVIVSSMARCRQSTKLLFHDVELVEVEELKECDFGDFEGKNYSMLNGNEDYQRWIDSVGTLPFPNGESVEEFKDRCKKAFLEIVNKYNSCKCLAFVVHGGSIMAIMEAFDKDKKNYFDYQVSNGEGYLTEYNEGIITVKKELKK